MKIKLLYFAAVRELDDYLSFLKGGCSKWPLDLLKDAGVDMTKPEPVATALGHFERHGVHFASRLVIAATAAMSSALAPRERSFTGFARSRRRTNRTSCGAAWRSRAMRTARA